MDPRDFGLTGEGPKRLMADLKLDRVKIRKKHMTATEAIAWQKKSLSRRHKRGLVNHLRVCKHCCDGLRHFLRESKYWDTPEGTESLKALQHKLRFVLRGIERSLRDKALGRKRGPGKVLKMADKERHRQ